MVTRQRAIYNEIEPYAAQWTRNLIAAGHVAPGVVDERSIVDLAPADVAGPGQRHFFAGIAVWSYALRLAGVPDDADIWTASCPCQPFSGAGRRRGTADERHLWPVLFALVEKCRPPVLFGEQVASRDGRAWLAAVRADLESLGYAVGAADLCAASVGAPHIRQRLYFVAYADGVEGRLLVQPWAARRADAQAGGRGEAGELADADDPGLEVIGEQPARRELKAAERGGEARRLVDASGARGGRDTGADARAEAAREGAWLGARRVGDEPCAASADGRAADADIAHAIDSDESRGGRLLQPAQDATARDPWSACDWIPCSDGKSRPVEPGTFPLAHGVAGRVGRLRAYGNAIVAQQAATFIRAALGAVTA